MNPKRRVLSVEDDPGSCELLGAILPDYEVINAVSITDALEQFRQEAFHYIILDQNLPDGTGVELFNRIRLTDKRTPVVFVTGVDDLDIGAAGECDGIIKKGSPDFYDRVLAFVDPERDPTVWNIV